MKPDFFRMRGAIAYTIGVAVFFIIAVVLIYAAGLFPGTLPAEQRADLQAQASRQRLTEGQILGRDGAALTGDAGPGTPAAAFYPSTARLIGYRSARYGCSGLRERWREVLLTGGRDDEGGVLATTIDPELSELGYSMLGSNGAACVLDASTGAVLACTSRQAGMDYDVNAISRDDEAIFTQYQTIDGFFLDAAVQASQPAGSTQKLITAVMALQNGLPLTYTDTGREPTGPDSYVVNFGSAVFGELDLPAAVRLSCNTYFSHLALLAGPAAALDAFRAFGYENEIVLDDLGQTILQKIDGSAVYSLDTLARVAFGYSVTSSPLLVAAEYQVLVGDGQIYKPYFVTRAEQDGKTVYENDGGAVLGAPDLKDADRDLLRQAFASAAESYGLTSSRFNIYAKTGTSEFGGGKNNLWLAAALEDHNTGAAYTAVLVRFDVESGISSHSLAEDMARIIRYLETNFL